MATANRLATETSPYLLQHAHNPVDWYPWGDEAFARARAEDKPVLLSVGYSACHWCHVMERESFEDEATAQLMNERFVSVKVDREERPDVDAIYMSAVQALTGQGGWPMTVFLTPDGSPFYGGTYYPPDDRHGLPGFRRVLEAVSDAYRGRRDDVQRGAAKLREMYEVNRQAMTPSGPLDPSVLDRAYRSIAQRHDPQYGGFGGAPKFPQAMTLDFLLRYWRRTGTAEALEMAASTFQHMVAGGIYDQVGGGFARYTVDARWMVPHFEKMLYDNALLLRFSAHLWQATQHADARRIALETAHWVKREMTAPSGGFYSALDADSEGEEGRFYLWTEDELHDALGDELARLAGIYFGVTKAGNFEGRNILHVPHDIRTIAARSAIDTEALRETVVLIRERLYEARARRVWPGRDEKIIASWNGLMLRALAEAARALDDPTMAAMALANGRFLFEELVRDGRVFRIHKDGLTRISGMLEDHAAVGLGALALYELTFDRTWAQRAIALAEAMIEWYWDDDTNAFFDTARDHETLIARPREVADTALPSGTSLAVELLWRTAELTRNVEHRRRAEFVLESLAAALPQYPLSLGHLLGVADLVIHGAVELALAGTPDEDGFRALAAEAARHYVPSLALAGGDPAQAGELALLEGRTRREGRPTAYVCRGYSCDAPVTDPAALGEQLERAATLRAGA